MLHLVYALVEYFGVLCCLILRDFFAIVDLLYFSNGIPSSLRSS